MKPLAQALCTSAIDPIIALFNLPAPENIDADDWLTLQQNLLAGTAAHESGDFKNRQQIGGGPALGLFEIEPPSLEDLYTNFLAFHADLKAKLDSLQDPTAPDTVTELKHNDRYGAGAALLMYWRHAKSIVWPTDPNDIAALGAIYKRYFNGNGKATPEEFVDDFARWVA